MIYITKIIGESFDLQTGEEHEGAVEITNGISTRLIPVPDRAIPVIVELFAEAHSDPEKEMTASVSAKIAEAVQESFEHQEQELARLEDPQFDPEDTDWGDDEPVKDLDDYKDEDTGVGSV